LIGALGDPGFNVEKTPFPILASIFPSAVSLLAVIEVYELALGIFIE
jgi:hypothetical protein